MNDLRALHLIVCVKKVSQSTARCADLLQKLITGIVGFFLLSTLMATCFLADCLQRVIKIQALLIIITLQMPGNVLRFKPQFLLARLILKSPVGLFRNPSQRLYNITCSERGGAGGDQQGRRGVK